MSHDIRIISGEEVSEAVSRLYARVCTVPDPTVEALLLEAMKKEKDGPGREALAIELENFAAARESGLPVCQDTGTAVVFIELGNKVCITGGTLGELVDSGVKKACEAAFLRSSQVFPPLYERTNTGYNTPAVIHIDHVQGSRIGISVLAKGAGCENVSRSEMLPPLSGEEGVLELARQCVLQGASRACPPVFLGIGLGGTLETSGILAKKALLREPGKLNSSERLRALEKRITDNLNTTGIGAQGFGGGTTVIETRICQLPCHMASLPVTVCVECHVHRTASCEI